MTEVYQEFLKYLLELGDTGKNRLWTSWMAWDGKPVIENTIIINDGLSLEDLNLGLSGLAQLSLYDKHKRTNFSIVDEAGPRFGSQGLVQKTLGGPENFVAQVVTKHIAHLLGDTDSAKQLVRIDRKSVVIADRFELKLHPRRDIHGELRFKK